MNIALDLLTIFIIGICIYTGVKKGFIQTLMGFAGGIIAFICAFAFSGELGRFLSEKWISPFFEKTVLTMFSASGQSAATAAEVPIEKTLSEGGTLIQNILAKFGANSETVRESLEGASQNLAAARENAIRAIYEPAAEAVSHVLAFLLIFVAVLVLVYIATKILNGIFSLPLLGGLNKFGGMIIGVARGVFFVWVLSLLVSISLPYAGSMGAFGVTEKNIENTMVFRSLYEISPLQNLLGSQRGK